MADQPVTRAGGQKRASGGQGAAGKGFLGQPGWMWAVGAGVIVLAYLYLKSHQSPQQAGQGGGQGTGGGGRQGGAGTGWTATSFTSWVTDHQGPPNPHKPKPKPKPKSPPDPDKGK
jgi:hypothetical protein